MNNKDIIEEIKAKLKASEALPYREGAWERFASKQGKTVGVQVFSFKRFASIAASGIAVLGISFYLYRNMESSLLPTEKQKMQVLTNPSKKSDANLSKSKVMETESMGNVKQSIEEIRTKSSLNPNKKQNNELAFISSMEGIKLSISDVSIPSAFTINELEAVHPVITTYKNTETIAFNVEGLRAPSYTTLAQQTIHAGVNHNPEENLNKSSKMSLSDKFELGLYVSPSRTSDQFDVGAGFLVSYALTDKISLRTGTSYNSYSVGVVKDPLEMASAEPISTNNMRFDSPISTGQKSAIRQEMIIPNINAVMGKVEAIEIPLDFSYKLNKGFYTSAGVSYSAIIKQQREAQYIENIGALTLSDKPALIPQAEKDLNKAQLKTIQSNQDNVNTQGFNGFANFSVGKKVDLKSKITFSLEPFVKVPLGQFRKSDLDYTNTGIRIITTF